jgi:protein-tyrosine phosphatase
MVNPPIGSENDVDEIIPRLFLGNEKSSYDLAFLQKYNIKYIIRMMPEFDKTREYPGITYYHIPIRDSKSCVGSKINYQHMLHHLTLLIDILLKRNDGSILVHCKRGHHRSASVVAAYLVKYKGLSYQESINYIKKIRPFALRKTTCIMNELYKYCLSHVK